MAKKPHSPQKVSPAPSASGLTYRSAGDTLSPDMIVRNTGWKKGREDRLSALQFKDLSAWCERFSIPLTPKG